MKLFHTSRDALHRASRQGRPFVDAGALSLFALLLAAGVSIVPGCTVRDCEGEPADETSEAAMEEVDESTSDGNCTEFVSRKRFNGTDTTETEAYTAGLDLTVDVLFGDVSVVEGEPGEVKVEFSPFVSAAHDSSDEDVERYLSGLETSVDADAERIAIEAGRVDDAHDQLGADVTIYLPPEFDGEIQIIQRSGFEMDVLYTADASTLYVAGDDSCTIHPGSMVDVLDVQCHDDITAVIKTVPAGDGVRKLTADRGAIFADFSAVTDPFGVSAELLDDGFEAAITFEDAGSCMVDETSTMKQSALCNEADSDAPLYFLETDTFGGINVKF